jgi:hypothetical protein
VPWVRLDEEFARHPKVLAAGPLGMAMQVAALCYCNTYLTDGFVPRSVVPGLLHLDDLDAEMLPGIGPDVGWKHVLKRVLDACLWEEVPGGYRIHDFHEYQPSKEQVLAEREQKKLAGQKGGRASAQARASARGQARAEAGAQAERQAESKPVPVPVPPVTQESAYVASVDAHEHTTAGSIIAAYAAGVPLSDHGRALRTVSAALDAGYDPDLVRRGIGVLIAEQRTCTPDTLRIAMRSDDPAPPAGRRRTATEKASQWLTVGTDEETTPLRALPGGLA